VVARSVAAGVLRSRSEPVRHYSSRPLQQEDVRSQRKDTFFDLKSGAAHPPNGGSGAF